MERTFSGKRAHDASVWEWILGPDGLAETVTVGSWDRLLRWSTPVFQLSEGFCSLLVIQCAGQITRWLVNRGGRSDSWMVTAPAFYTDDPLIIFTDWLACNVCISHLQLRLFSLESNSLPRDWQRGCYPDRNNNYVCRHFMRLGHWERKREPCRKLTPIRLHRSMSLSDIHRLPTYESRRTSSSSSAGCRLSPISAFNHGILHNFTSGALSPAVCDPCRLQLRHRRSQYHYAIRHHLARIPPVRSLRIDPHYSSSPRIWSTSTVPRSIIRRFRWCNTNPSTP